MKKALVIIDMINDIISENGKLSAKGYFKFLKENNIIENLNKNIENFRKNGDDIIFVNLSFKKDYSDQNKKSLLFGKAHEFLIFEENSWGTKIFSKIDYTINDKIFIKNRVSSFYKTDLEKYLNKEGIVDLFFAGCAIDLAVESSVRDAHDRDFNVFVLQDSCVASDFKTFEKSLRTLSKIAYVV